MGLFGSKTEQKQEDIGIVIRVKDQEAEERGRIAADECMAFVETFSGNFGGGVMFCHAVELAKVWATSKQRIIVDQSSR